MPRRMVAFDKVIDRLMGRLGFVRLGRYGLLMSPEDRILSLRPAIDDGMGGRIVGWRDTDLVSAELHPWQATIPSLVQTPAAPPAYPMFPAYAAAPALAVRAPVAPPPLPPRAAAMISPVVAPRAAEPPKAPKAPEPPEPPEEDWEWTLAVARARAAADAPAVPAEPEIDSWDDQSCTALPPPPQAQPVRTVIPVPSLTRGAQLPPLAYRAEPVAPAPARVSMMKPAPASRLAPIAKVAPAAPRLASVVPLESRRFPRGTRPVEQDMVAANDDRTDTQIHAAPARDEQHDTRTQVRAASVRAIPSIKQRMAGR